MSMDRTVAGRQSGTREPTLIESHDLDSGIESTGVAGNPLPGPLANFWKGKHDALLYQDDTLPL